MSRRNLNRKHVSEPSSSTSTPLHDEVIEYDPLRANRIYLSLSSLPPGCRFVPSDVELIRDYLRPKIANQQLPLCLIHPVNLYRFHPRTLAEKYVRNPDGQEAYYFSPRNRKYMNGKRPSRTVEGFGFWKANGADDKIKLGDELIGYKKTLVFYKGKHPGEKTNWIMHEYRTCESRKRTSNADMKLDDWVLCRIREKEETGRLRNKKNKEAIANTITSDTDTEKNLFDPVAVKDDNVITVKDEEDNRLSTNYGSTSYHNQIPDYGEEDNCLNANYGSTSYQNQITHYHEEENRLNANYASTSYHNQITGYNEEENRLIANYGSTSYHNQITGYNKEENRLIANYGSTSYHNQITGYNEEENRLIANYGSTSYHNQITAYNEENNSLIANYGTTTYHNQITAYNEEYKHLNANYSSTSYHNELYQSHQDIGPPLAQTPSYQFDTCRGNFNKINDNYALGGASDELSCVPGPCCTNELLTDGVLNPFDTCRGNFNMINENYALGDALDELSVPGPSHTNELLTDGVLNPFDTCRGDFNMINENYALGDALDELSVPGPSNTNELSTDGALNQFDTCRGNFNMINDNHALGSVSDELNSVPGPSQKNELLTDGGWNDQWPSRTICDNGFDTFYVDSDKFQAKQV